ncbi:hypothetical protein Q3G72_003022 [Acer saccharum]|nr:hypothetical protein Q3G72_003022 [Acer saccharum]
MSSKKLRIGVVPNSGFPELVNIHHNLETNITTITGFCIDVFRAAIEQLPYQVEYELIPFPDRDRSKAPINDLFNQMYLQDLRPNTPCIESATEDDDGDPIKFR